MKKLLEAVFMKDHKLSASAIQEDKSSVEEHTILATNFCCLGTQVNPSVY